jgi:hypothetical protein
MATTKTTKTTKATKATKTTETARNYKMDAKEVAALKTEAKAQKSFPNPYRGCYGALVAALAALGLNKWHSFSEVKAAVKKNMGENWEAFQAKAARNKETGKDVDGRLLQNLTVLQRVNDYGKKLLQVNAVIDLKREGKEVQVRLNTNSKEPQKMGRAK